MEVELLRGLLIMTLLCEPRLLPLAFCAPRQLKLRADSRVGRGGVGPFGVRCQLGGNARVGHLFHQVVQAQAAAGGVHLRGCLVGPIMRLRIAGFHGSGS